MAHSARTYQIGIGNAAQFVYQLESARAQADRKFDAGVSVRIGSRILDHLIAVVLTAGFVDESLDPPRLQVDCKFKGIVCHNPQLIHTRRARYSLRVNA